jgi:retinol dehydrogenase-14
MKDDRPRAARGRFCVTAVTHELARRVRGSGVTATVLHPGVGRTAFGAEDQAAFFTILSPLIRPFLKTANQGAATSIYLAASPQAEG